MSGGNVACWVFGSGAYMVDGGLLCFLIYGVRFWFLLLVVLMPDGFEVVFGYSYMVDGGFVGWNITL